jgi:tripartite-type tricarboxylate transporter receptor subunit TctC
MGLMLGLGAATAVVGAEPWPQRSVRLVVPFGPGTAPDFAARIYAEQLAARWKRPVIVENNPGADGLIGVTAFARAGDDHTLLFSPAAPISVFPYTQGKLAYDPARDFVPISSAVDTFGAIAIAASLNVGSLAELVTLARARPGALNWAGAGGAFPTLLAGFARTNGVDMTQVSYRDPGLAIQDLAEGRIHVMATTLTQLLPMVRAGKVRIVAVTNKKRASIVADIPTAIEAGHPELEFEGLIGLFGWRDMPEALRDRIAEDLRAVAADPVVVERLAKAGQITRASGSAEFASAIEEQRARIQSIVQLMTQQKP